MSKRNVFCSLNEPIVKVEIATSKSKSIWELMEVVANFLAIAEKYNGQYIQLEPRRLEKGKTKAVEFELSFSNKKSCKKFLKSCKKYYLK